MIVCTLCGYGADDRKALGDHLATDHPDEWEMAVSVAALEVMGAARFT